MYRERIMMDNNKIDYEKYDKFLMARYELGVAIELGNTEEIIKKEEIFLKIQEETFSVKCFSIKELTDVI